jgi:hypothetical protein
MHSTSFRTLSLVAAIAGSTALVACSSEPTAELPTVGAKTDETSVSGISSGAYMAGQFQMAHGSLVNGAAIIAGGPYGCAESVFADAMMGPGMALLNLTKAINGCMQNALMVFGVPSISLLASKAEERARAELIDPLESVRGDKVYLFAGKEDRTVVPAIVRTAKEFYERLGVPAANIRLVEDMDAGHAFVTEDKGLACEETGKPYIVDCDYDQAGELLGHIYGKLTPRAAMPSGSWMIFDQRAFTRDLQDHGMADQGAVYLPKECVETEGCRVHIAFHGCAQNRASIDDAYVKGTGLERWADTNRLVVLFPQTSSGAMNPQGCWDWWGYTGRDYLTKKAPQIIAVRRMLDRLGQKRGPVG